MIDATDDTHNVGWLALGRWGVGSVYARVMT